MMLLMMLLMICITACGKDSTESSTSPEPPVEPEKPDEPSSYLPMPVLSFSSLSFANEGDDFACLVHRLKDNEWSATSDQSWCQVSVQGKVLKIKVLPNDGIARRTAVISLLHSDNRSMGEIAVEQGPVTDDGGLESSTFVKSTYFPMFTATWCPYSPQMDKTLPEIQTRLGRSIIPMRIHVSESDLYTPLSTELSQMYDNNIVPQGYFENYLRIANDANEDAAIGLFWNTVLAGINDQPAYTDKCSKLRAKASMSETTIQSTVTVTPVAAGSYRVAVFVLEDNIISPQTTATGVIDDYKHDATLVGALTPLRGEEMQLTEAVKSVTFTGAIPEGVDKANIRLLVVLQRDIAALNYSADCWYADNCLSVPLGKNCSNGQVENIFIGDKIEY